MENISSFTEYRHAPAPFSDLGKLYSNLLKPFKNNQESSLNIKKVIVKTVGSDTDLKEQAGNIVNYAYNSRYNFVNGNVIDISRDNFDALPASDTLVAVQEIEDRQVVLGTFRILCGRDLDVFQLFKSNKINGWPHEQKSLIPGELGRFGLHPILDVMKESNEQNIKGNAKLLQRLILRKMWEPGMSLMKKNGVQVPYFILANRIVQFIKSAGIIPQQVEDVVALETEYSRNMRNEFPGYWRSDKPPSEQPAVYIAPWDLKPLTAQSNGNDGHSV